LHYKRDKTKPYYIEQAERSLERKKAYDKALLNKMCTIRAIAKAAEIIVRNRTSLLVKEDYEEIAKVFYGKITYVNVQSIKRVMKMDEVQERVKQTVSVLLAKHNLGVDKPFELLKDAEKVAKETKKPESLINIAKILLDLNDLTTKSKVTATETTTYTPGQLDEVYENAHKEVTNSDNGVVKSVKVVKKVELETNNSDMQCINMQDDE
jgi:hypothetical protein